jgi:hypothetical protein
MRASPQGICPPLEAGETGAVAVLSVLQHPEPVTLIWLNAAPCAPAAFALGLPEQLIQRKFAELFFAYGHRQSCVACSPRRAGGISASNPQATSGSNELRRPER